MKVGDEKNAVVSKLEIKGSWVDGVLVNNMKSSDLGLIPADFDRKH